MEHFNPVVISALMSLRGIGVDSLCKLAHVSHPNMARWLNGSGDEASPAVPVATQHEIARMLGVEGESLRGDVVHYWQVHEPFFSRRETTYRDLGHILQAFGRAEVAFLARESDRALTFGAKSCFALRFAGFCAILEVTAHPMRTISFDPDEMSMLDWVPESFGVLLTEGAYDNLQPGAMHVAALQKRLAATADQPKWEQLRHQAEELDIPAEAMLTALAKLVPVTHRVEHSDSPRDVSPAVENAVQQEAAPAPAAPVLAAVAPAPAPAVSVIPPAKAVVEQTLFSRTQPVRPLRAAA